MNHESVPSSIPFRFLFLCNATLITDDLFRETQESKLFRSHFLTTTHNRTELEEKWFQNLCYERLGFCSLN